MPPGICTNEDLKGDESCSANTGHPINILTGGKKFIYEDFRSADGALLLNRRFNARPFGGAGGSFVEEPRGLANWRYDLQLELQIGDDWATARTFSLLTPAGQAHVFERKTNGTVAPYRPADRPLPQTEFTLSFLDTWPSNLSTLTTKVTHWKATDAANQTWYLETALNPDTGDYRIARPTRMVLPNGETLFFTYGGQQDLLWISDAYGKQITFDWVYVADVPAAIAAAHLPDGTTIRYVYDSFTTLNEPARLARVEWVNASNVVEDKVSYDYGDDRFPRFITGIRDLNNVLRWSVTYDGEGRTTSSTGPSGVENYSIAYGPSGDNFTRTVTNPLGKQSVYNYTRTSPYYDVKLVSIDGVASAHCPASSAATTYGVDQFIATETDEEGRVTAYVNNSRGLPTQVTEAQGTAKARVTSFTWDSTLALATQVMQPGLTTSATYDTSVTTGGSDPADNFTSTYSYDYTGAAQQMTVPAGMTSATIKMWGGAGGNGNYVAGAWSGAGGYVRATFPVSPGDILTFDVGGGGAGAARNANGGLGGWPDGGSGARGDTGSGGGGGSSRFSINSVLKAVAGGGGGSGGYDGSAGSGGGITGQSAESVGGSGGTQSAPGFDMDDPTEPNKTGRSLVTYPGAQRTGGWGSSTGSRTVTTSDDGGGGGGGYYGGGGGGGDGQSGGGGSGFVPTGPTSVINTRVDRQTPYAGAPTGKATGVNSGNGGSAKTGGHGYAFLGLR